MNNAENQNTLHTLAQLVDLDQFSVAENHTLLQKVLMGTQQPRMFSLQIATMGASTSRGATREARTMCIIGRICPFNHPATTKTVNIALRKTPCRYKDACHNTHRPTLAINTAVHWPTQATRACRIHTKRQFDQNKISTSHFTYFKWTRRQKQPHGRLRIATSPRARDRFVSQLTFPTRGSLPRKTWQHTVTFCGVRGGGSCSFLCSVLLGVLTALSVGERKERITRCRFRGF